MSKAATCLSTISFVVFPNPCLFELLELNLSSCVVARSPQKNVISVNVPNGTKIPIVVNAAPDLSCLPRSGVKILSCEKPA